MNNLWEVWDMLEPENFNFRITDSKHSLETQSGLVIQMQLNNKYNLEP